MNGSQFVALAESARAGDRSALGQILDSFRSYLRVIADRKLAGDLKPKCSPSDLVQLTFLDAQATFARFEGAGPEELRLWLERILLNNLGDVVRQFRLADKRNIQREVPLRNAAEVDELIDLSTPSTKLAAHEETDRLQRSLARLPDDYRQIILLRNLERRKFEEIAALMDRTVGAVKKLWSRAIMKLKQEMNADERR